MNVTYKHRSWYNLLFGWHLAYLWTSLNTLIGLIVWLVAAGHKPFHGIAHPGLFILRITPHSPLGRYFNKRGLVAIPFGHTILLLSVGPYTLGHELVHVRQYEILGPLFLPLYGLFSLILWILRKDAYFNNPFEQQAYKKQTLWTSKYIKKQ